MEWPSTVLLSACHCKYNPLYLAPGFSYKVYRYFLKILKGFLMKIWKNFQILFSSAYKLQLLIHLYFTPACFICQYLEKIFYCLSICGTNTAFRERKAVVFSLIPRVQLHAAVGWSGWSAHNHRNGHRSRLRHGTHHSPPAYGHLRWWQWAGLPVKLRA